jgi:membrane fusion protein
MLSIPLFRPAALAAQRTETLGTVSLATPISFALLGAALAAIAACLAAFACFGEYTAHRTLRGRIVPLGGIVEVTSPQAGVLLERRAVPGRRVSAGEPLFVVSGERTSARYGATQAAIAAQLERRRASLAEQAAQTGELERAEREALAGRLAALERESGVLAAALAAQHESAALAAAAAARAARLRDQGHLSVDQAAQAQAALLEQRTKVGALEREAAALLRARAELVGRAATLAPQYANERAELERALAETELEAAGNEAQRAVVVTAPRAGVVGVVVGELGEATEAGALLASIVPEGEPLVAELYAESRAVGFVATGDEVRLRHAAFPYQKFGHARGTVLEVATTPLATPLPGATGGRGEPVYRVVVALESGHVTAYGDPRPLLAGMSVEADVLLDTRRIYEWLFEPLFALAPRAAP